MHGMEDGADVIKIILAAPEMSLEDMMRPGMHGPLKHEGIDKEDLFEKTMGFMKDACGNDEGIDWKSVAKQLMQAVSLIDTHTDGVLEDGQDAGSAIQAIDNETSRLLWGKQDSDNPESMYQNKSYLDKVANGFMMGGKDEDEDEKHEEKEEKEKEECKEGECEEEKEKHDDDLHEPGDDEFGGKPEKKDKKRKGDPKLGGRPNNMFGKFDDDDDDDEDEDDDKKEGKHGFPGLR